MTCTLSSETFDHTFEGWSVWIEPYEKDSVGIVNEIEFLAEQCGGNKCGVHSFVPHCTLLYNLTPITTTDATLSEQQLGEQLLNKCIDTFRQKCDSETPSGQEDASHTATTIIQQQQQQQQQQHLIPTSFYYFHYPKHADDGKGFGCVISLILLEKTLALQRLHEAVTLVFPPDERQNNFVPHVSLVYAPENMAEWLQQYTKDLEEAKKDLLCPINAQYLSLWSTQGQIKDWYRIARVELS